ncbi:helix-turn-helix transcriptional regulator [Marmoricola sp. RAF53]|uniref:helix-turn-helix transcriptional regulator n=1 Tax=Marmoricola sp. RAF53 TaxID=3233059 RepID=UPI003F9600EF
MDRDQVLADVLRLVAEQRTGEATALVEDWAGEQRDPFAAGLRVLVAYLAGRHADAVAAYAAATGTERDPVAHACLLAAGGWLSAAVDVPGGDPLGALPDALAPLTTTDRVGAFVVYLAVEGALASNRLDVATALIPDGPAPRVAWTGHPFAGVMLACDARLAVFAGRVAEARELLAEIEPEGVVGSLLLGTAALAAGNAADLESMRRLVAEVAADDVAPTDHLGRGVHLLLAYAVVALGDRTEASRHLLTAGGDADLSGLNVVDRALGYELLVAAAADEADLDAASSWLARAEPIAGHRAAAGCVERMRSRVALLAGEVAAATAHAAQAVTLARADGRAVEAAEAEVVLARARIAADDIPAATQALRDAVIDSDQTGHLALRHAASRTLRAAGRRLPPVTGGGHDALTPRERAVADLILAGHDSDAIARLLHVSPATVRTHASRVLAAYGVSTRIGLLAAVHELPEQPVTPADLTPQQGRVAALIAFGKSNQQIADALGISVKGVEKHVGDILTRSRAGNRFGIALDWWNLQA